MFRYTSPTQVFTTGKHIGEPTEPQMGLGGYHVVSLKEARARADGKQAAVKIESNAIGGDYRVGRMRIDVDPQGGR
jgi:hypothetical protein